MDKRAILYVDDDVKSLDGFRFMVGKEFEVLTALTGEEALRILREREIPVVIADYRMEPMNGVEFLKKVQEVSPESIRVMLTANMDRSVTVQAINEAHVYSFLQKPIEVGGREALVFSLNQWIGVYDLRAELKKAKAKLEEYSHQLEKLVEERTKQLLAEQRFGLIGKMGAQVAHDLKSPYDSFQYFREFMGKNLIELGRYVTEGGKGLYEEIKQMVEEDVEVAVGLMGNMVEGLNAYGRTTGRVEELEVTQGIEKVLKLYANPWRGRIEVKREYQPIPKIRGRSGEVLRIWSNLLGNSGSEVLGCEKCKGGKGEIRIGVKSQARDRKEGVEVKIRDNGPGIPEERRGQLFDLGTTTKGEGEGAGMGLVIAKSVVDLHGGKIEVDSDPGNWTEFTVWLSVEGPREEGEGKTS